MVVFATMFETQQLRIWDGDTFLVGMQSKSERISVPDTDTLAQPASEECALAYHFQIKRHLMSSYDRIGTHAANFFSFRIGVR